jgi:hypothetical protein
MLSALLSFSVLRTYATATAGFERRRWTREEHIVSLALFLDGFSRYGADVQSVVLKVPCAFRAGSRLRP